MTVLKDKKSFEKQYFPQKMINVEKYAFKRFFYMMLYNKVKYIQLIRGEISLTQFVTYTRDEINNYAMITLNRPKKRNAISLKMIEKLSTYVKEAKDSSIKCLVITGTGDKMFCAGGDLNDFHPELSIEEAFSRLNKMKEVLLDIVSFPVPTICLLNGDALGGGCELATSCDFRIAKEDTTFGFIQSSLGIIPGWGGGTLLYEKVEHNFAYQWLLEANVYKAVDLLKKGWIHNIVAMENLYKLDKLLKPYMQKSFEQMKFLKAQYKEKLCISHFSKLMTEEVRRCAELWSSPRHVEKVQQFLTKK